MTKKSSDLLSICPIIDYASQGNAILGIRDSGKTYSATYIAERLMDNNIPIIVFDPIGVWRYLKMGKNAGGFGSKPGYPIVVAGEGGDLPLTPENAPEIVRAAMRENVSLVLDLYSMGLSKADWKKIVASCLRVLLYENKDCGLRHVFIEEASEFCLSPDTEILLKSGWRKYDQINEGDTAICFDKEKNSLIEGDIQRVIVRNFNGELLNFKNRQIDILVTPEHRNLIRRFQHDPKRYKLYDYDFVPAEKCPKQFLIPSVSTLNNPDWKESELTDDILRIIGWVITDGCFHHKKKRKNLALSQSHNTKKLNRFIFMEMTMVLDRYGVKHRDRVRKERKFKGRIKPSPPFKCREWVFNLPLSLKMLSFLKENIHRIPREIIEKCSQRQLRVLYNGLMEGDGTSDGKTKWRYFYAGLDEGLADDIQELCAKIGVRAIKSFVKLNGQWRLSISNQKEYWVRHHPDKIKYNGIVWDVTVPTGAFMVRRNGRVWITGNCPQRVRPEEGYVYAEMEKLARMGGNASLGYTLINQRAEEVNKAVLELCDCLFLHRQKGRNSLTALEKWLNVADTPNPKEIIKTLPSLKQGECWVWLQGSHNPVRLSVPEKNTYHPDRRNPLTSTAKMLTTDVSLFVQKIKNTMRFAVPSETAPVKGKAGARENVQLRRQDNYQYGQGNGFENASVDASVNKIKGLELRVAKLEKELYDEQKKRGEAESKLKMADKSLQAVRKMLAPQFEQMKVVFAEMNNAPDVAADKSEYDVWLQKFGGKKKMMLEILIERGRVTRSQLGVLVGMAYNGGSFGTYISELRTVGLLKKEGDEFVLQKI